MSATWANVGLNRYEALTFDDIPFRWPIPWNCIGESEQGEATMATVLESS